MFSSGHDLKELTEEQGCDYHAEIFQTCSEVSQDDGCIASMQTMVELNTKLAFRFADEN